MTSPWPLLLVMTDTQWTVLGGAFGALLLAITTISVALINRSTGKQNSKDETAVETVADLTIELSNERLKTTEQGLKISAQSSEITRLKDENKWLRKQQEK